MKKLAILGSAVAFLLLSNIANYAKTTSQSTQQNKTDTEQVAEDSTNKSEPEQEQNPVDTQQETDSSTNKPESTNNYGY
ncbi:hypothetical protein [Dulcicalothrix desertica]|nr:hypothetical protein [Dulcicalothrix desertica]TWH55289.1 hypothetical protein CAL7102_03413 [Dulcicalothrix desertica PCC 7102]